VGHDQQMSAFEAVMWELERDPHLSSAFANLTTLDRPPDRLRLRARMESASRAVPRLRQRVLTPTGRFSPPEWQDDPDFDLDRHLRWIDLGGDADDADVRSLAATLSRQPFDRSRPLWEFIVVEGLRGGRAAMLQRLHHTLTDGKGGIRLSVEFLDLERDPAPTRTATPGSGSGAPDDPTDDADDLPASPGVATPSSCESPGPIGRWTATAVAAVRQPVGLVGGALANVGTAATRPAELPARSAEVARTMASAARQVAVDPRRSPLWRDRSLDRWFGTTEIPLATVIDAAHRVGATVNDLFVAGAAAAAGAYHRRSGEPVDFLRVSIPISTRHDRSAGGNAFAPSQTLVPTGDLDPIERIALVHATLSDVKGERALGSVETMASWLAMLPSLVVVRAGQQMAGSVDFVCSNVKAAPFDLFVGGALIEQNFPLGPLAGTAFNLTTMSYRGSMCMGLVVDPAAVDDPPALLDDVERAYSEIIETIAQR
jgi:WS/DGAT/MGAT family acyltransferase